METYTDNQIRQAIIKALNPDKVKHASDGSWHALWYQHPHNVASNGHWVLMGLNNTDAAKYLMGNTCDADLFA